MSKLNNKQREELIEKGLPKRHQKLPIKYRLLLSKFNYNPFKEKFVKFYIFASDYNAVFTTKTRFSKHHREYRVGYKAGCFYDNTIKTYIDPVYQAIYDYHYHNVQIKWIDIIRLYFKSNKGRDL